MTEAIRLIDEGGTAAPVAVTSETVETLRSIERRVLWLATRMIDYANHERAREDELKVGGHQASSASLVTLMTALYAGDLDAADKVAVKPHASPVLHALEFLLGRLDGSYLTRLRDFGGLQSYPSRTKDPFPVDYSTGSVGLGSAAPLFGALADRFVASRVGRSTGGRFISLLGDAELDEGNLWEAIAEPLTRSLGNVLWIVDVNRQSLDRVVPGIRAPELEAQFRACGWNLIELKYGGRLRAAFEAPGGDTLRRCLDEMSNEVYQSMFGASEQAIRRSLLDSARQDDRHRLAELLGGVEDLGSLVADLGGHDLADILGALADARCERDRPTVVFAYTIKGYGLEIAGRPGNHSALLQGEQVNRLRDSVGLTAETEWDAFPSDSREQRLLADAARRLRGRERPVRRERIEIPARISDRDSKIPVATQAAFGRLLLDLARHPSVGPRIVSVSPDVSVSTNLGGFINRVGVWTPRDDSSAGAQADDGPLDWRLAKDGQHIEVGIAEMNFALLLGQLGLAPDYQEVQLFPFGTLYDPFVMRALEGIVYSVYSGSRFILVGTPSGVSLSREGGAHQSINTPGIGIETPGLTYAEPCFARELEWLLLDGLSRMQESDGEALYLRLSTTPVDQAPFAAAVGRYGEDALREFVVRGGFRLREAARVDDRIVIAACGAVVPHALRAADLLSEDEGVEATVVALSSPDRLYRDWREAVSQPLRGRAPRRPYLMELLESEQAVPLVTVVDGASHSLAWLGSALGVRTVPLGVDRFGQVGSQASVLREYQIDAEAIVSGALAALEPV